MPTDAELESLYGEAWKEPDSERSETGGTEAMLARSYLINGVRLSQDLE